MTFYPNIQVKPIYMLNLSILKFIIQIYIQYIILFLSFKKFKVYNEFKIRKNKRSNRIRNQYL